MHFTMTPSASRCVGPEPFTAQSKKPAVIDVFSTEDPGTSWTRHIHLAEWADLYVIAPCTANTLAKLVHGLADNMLTSIFLDLKSTRLNSTHVSMSYVVF